MQCTHLPARYLEIVSVLSKISSVGVPPAKRFQKYRRSWSVRILFRNLFKENSGGLSCSDRVMIARTLRTWQISVPTRKANGKGRGGMEGVWAHDSSKRLKVT
jgi:hypothetical protein